MAEFVAITTQEAFDAAIRDRLAREQKKFDELQAGWMTEKTALEQSLTAEKAKTEAAQNSLNEANQKITDLQLKDYRVSAAVANGIPLDFADRITGTDQDAINADAAKIAPYFRSAGTSAPLANNDGASGGKPEDAAMKSFASTLFGGN